MTNITSIIVQAVTLALAQFLSKKISSFKSKLESRMGYNAKIKEIEKLKEEILALQVSVDEKINNLPITAEEKDRLSEEFADSIADKLRAMGN